MVSKKIIFREKFIKNSLFYIILVLALTFTAIISSSAVSSQSDASDVSSVTVYFFWGDGCPHCSAEKPFLDEMQEKYPGIEIKMFETWKNPENAKLFNDVAKAYGTTAQGVPTTFIGDKFWVGYADYMGVEMESKIQDCLEKECLHPEMVLEAGSLAAAQALRAESQSESTEQEETEPKDSGLELATEELCLHAFIIGNCAQCSSVLPLLEATTEKHDVALKIHDASDPAEAELYQRFKDVYSIPDGGFPVVFLGDRFLMGESVITAHLDTEIASCKETNCVCPASKIVGLTPYPPQPDDITPEESSVVTLPVLGKIDTANMSLPLFTIILAGLDSFNPCAFFVLFFLLSMLIYAKDRKRMLLIGLTFVFFSALIYFLFMAAWLNLFLLIGQLMIITTIAGIVALIVAGINIKDFFFFERGISLVIPESAKPKLFEKMRNLLKATSLSSMMLGTIVLAIAANSYELLCTAGFPMVFTRILTLNGISTGQYYVYLALYNIVYIIPLLIIVIMFVITLGARKLTEWQGRILKLISGMMMLCLGLILLIQPALLNNIFVSIGLMVAALSTAGIIVFVTKKMKKKEERRKDDEDPK